MIGIKINGLNRLIKTAEQYPAVAEKHVNLGINQALVFIWGMEKTQAPFGVSGLVRDNWRVEVGRFKGSLVSLSPYAIYVHEGTRPHMPPIDSIMPWAKKKGINPWAVAMSIKKKGTKPNPFLQRAVDASQTPVEKIFELALSSTLDELATLNDSI